MKDEEWKTLRRLHVPRGRPHLRPGGPRLRVPAARISMPAEDQHLEYRLGVFQGVRGTDSRNAFRVAGRAVWYRSPPTPGSSTAAPSTRRSGCGRSAPASTRRRATTPTPPTCSSSSRSTRAARPDRAGQLGAARRRRVPDRCCRSRTYGGGRGRVPLREGEDDAARAVLRAGCSTAPRRRASARGRSGRPTGWPATSGTSRQPPVSLRTEGQPDRLPGARCSCRLFYF